MFEIIHEIPFKCSANRLFNAITMESSLSEWWLKGASYKAEIGAIGTFPFSDNNGAISMRVLEMVKGKKQVWECLEHKHSDWIGTIITFEIESDSDSTCRLKFKHSHWKTTTGVFGQVSYYWAAAYLHKLKTILE